MAQQLTLEKVRHLGRDVRLPDGCPLQTPAIAQAFQSILRQAGSFSHDIGQHALARGPEADAWLHQAAVQARPLLRPWVMEIIFVIGAHGHARFGELEAGLGISSKVLATRLRELAESGQVERHVEATTPVTITYRLTKAGRATAALATPLFAHLNLLA